MILLNDCVQLLTSSRALSAFTWRGQATSLSSCTEKGQWGKDRKGHKSGKEQDKSEVQEERCRVWEVKAIGTEERAQSPLGEWWRKWWDLYLKDFGCLREFNLPHIAEGESHDKSGSVILLVGLQTTSLVQWRHVMHLLLVSDLFLLAWDSHQISLHWKTGECITTTRLSRNCRRMWVLLPEQWTGVVVGLEMQCVNVGDEIRAARQQQNLLGVWTFIWLCKTHQGKPPA